MKMLFVGNFTIIGGRAGLKPVGPVAPNWAPRLILQTLVQVDWEPGPTEIVPNWAPHLLRPVLMAGLYFVRSVNV